MIFVEMPSIYSEFCTGSFKTIPHNYYLLLKLNYASAPVLLHIRRGNLDWNESHEKKLNLCMLQLPLNFVLE